MTVTLYNSPGERNRLSRDMILIKEMTAAQATEVINIETPSLLINRDDTVIGFNYAYIPKFNRYYFLNSMEVVNGNQFRINLESDPLMSFKDAILSSPCIAKRSSSAVNPELEDNEAAFKTIPSKINRKMAVGFTPSASGGCYILTLGGK